MIIKEQKLKGVFTIQLESYKDFRGGLVRTYDKCKFDEFGIDSNWSQESISTTSKKNTLRGLHVSLPPTVEGKLINHSRGAMLWVIVDLRKDSFTFGHHEKFEISKAQTESIFVPKGFAHGCLSLSDNCELIIKSNAFFVEQNGTGIRWDDPQLGIDWGVHERNLSILKRDGNYPLFQSFLDVYKFIEI